MHDDSHEDPIEQLHLTAKHFSDQPTCWQVTVNRVKERHEDQVHVLSKNFVHHINQYLVEYNLTYVRFTDVMPSMVMGKRSDLLAWMLSHG